MVAKWEIWRSNVIIMYLLHQWKQSTNSGSCLSSVLIDSLHLKPIQRFLTIHTVAEIGKPLQACRQKKTT